MWVLYPDQIEIWNFFLAGRPARKPEYLEKNPRSIRQEHDSAWTELYPGHIGGRRVLSPLCQVYSSEVQLVFLSQKENLEILSVIYMFALIINS